MHHCLRVAEIVSLIARKLRSKNALRTLVSFSLTCEAVCGPALDELWRHDVDLINLIRVLPANVVAERNNRLIVISAPSKLDWSRFDRYARCAQSALWWNHRDSFLRAAQNDAVSELSVDWASALKYYPTDQPLPHLRSLRCNIELDAVYSQLLLLPPLKDLHLSYDSEQSILTMVQGLSACADILQKLEINTWRAKRNVNDFEYVSSLSRPVFSMRALVSLKVSALTLEAVEHLASLPHLESFTACVRMFGREQPSTTLQFPSLKYATFGVHYTELPEFTNMLRCTVAPRLEMLEVEYFVPPGLTRAKRPTLPSTSNLEDLCITLTKFTNLEVLEFEISQIGEYRYIWRDDGCLSGAVLSRLFVLRRLRTLSMARVPFDLHPRDVEAIACAWPKMQDLRLGDMACGLKDRLESLLCVDDLRPIALHCTQLTQLGLGLRIPAQYDQDPIPAPVTSVCPLQWLHPGLQGVEFSIRDAAVLNNFFPDVYVEDLSDNLDQGIEASRMSELIETMTLLLERQRQQL